MLVIRECNGITLVVNNRVYTVINGDKQHSFDSLQDAKFCWINSVLDLRHDAGSYGINPDYNFVKSLDPDNFFIVAQNDDTAACVNANMPYLYHKRGKFAGYFESMNAFNHNYIDSQTFQDSEGYYYRSYRKGWMGITRNEFNNLNK